MPYIMAAQQENLQISNSLSSAKQKRRARRKRGPKSASEKCCMILIMISPVFLVLMFVYFVGIYNEAVQYEQVLKKLNLRTSEANKAKSNAEVAQLAGSHGPKPSDSKQSVDVGHENIDGGGTTKETLVLSTSHGDIRITLRPDLSAGSVDYIHRLVEARCERCKLYRAEQKGILQGIMAKQGVSPNNEKGTCPPEALSEPVGECPNWDKSCGCHGPIMTRGSVGWAAGSAGGPDFFIDNYPRPAKWWGTQHTNFGFIEDKKSLEVIDFIFSLPTEKKGLTYLKDAVQFKLRLE